MYYFLKSLYLGLPLTWFRSIVHVQNQIMKHVQNQIIKHIYLCTMWVEKGILFLYIS